MFAGQLSLPTWHLACTRQSLPSSVMRLNLQDPASVFAMLEFISNSTPWLHPSSVDQPPKNDCLAVTAEVELSNRTVEESITSLGGRPLIILMSFIACLICEYPTALG